jgi:cytochrome c oxidase subunit 1
MTITETRPPATSRPDAAVAPTPFARETWLTTGDHKKIGLLFIYGGILALLAGCVASAVFQLFGDTVASWTQPGSRLAGANAIASLVIGIPAIWIGLATYVVPLQIGATRLALPRLHNLALWTYFSGGVLIAIGVFADKAHLNSLASSVPSTALDGQSAKPITELLIAGVFVVALATLLAAISLVTTVLVRRTEGMRLEFMPFFSWSTLATASVLLLATPVFLAGLVLLYFDHHYGGTLFASGRGGLRVWQHELWWLGQPFALLFAAAAVGLLTDVVSTHAGRPIVGFRMARVAAAAAPALTLLLWAGNLGTLDSPFAPVATLGGALVGLPLLLALLAWLRTLQRGKPSMHSSLLFAVAFLLVIGFGTALSLVAVLVGVDAPDAEAFRNGQITLLAFGAPLLALAAGAAHWAPKLWGRTVPTGMASLQCLLLLVGVVLASLPGYLVGLGGSASLAPIGAIGAVVTAAGLSLFFVNLATRAPATERNPYGGLTLEWATDSPPPAHNFTDLPIVRSPYPLAEAGVHA